MYERLTWIFDDSREIKERHTGRYGAPGQKRKKKSKPTPEQMKENNKRNRIERYRRLIKWNFVPGRDYWITFTYRKTDRPENRKQAQKIMENFRERLRRRYDKAGEKMKWLCITEIGSKGAVHHHMILNRIPDLDAAVSKLWKHGYVSIKLLYKEGDFEALANYLCKESKVNRSHNLIEKDPQVRPMKRCTWPDEIKIPKGYYLDRDSVREGVNKYGYPYRRYIIIKLPGGGKKSGKCGKRGNLHRGRQKDANGDQKVHCVPPGNGKDR